MNKKIFIIIVSLLGYHLCQAYTWSVKNSTDKMLEVVVIVDFNKPKTQIINKGEMKDFAFTGIEAGLCLLAIRINEPGGRMIGQRAFGEKAKEFGLAGSIMGGYLGAMFQSAGLRSMRCKSGYFEIVKDYKGRFIPLSQKEVKEFPAIEKARKEAEAKAVKAKEILKPIFPKSKEEEIKALSGTTNVYKNK